MSQQPPGFANYPRPSSSSMTPGGYHRPPGIYLDAIGEAWPLVRANLGAWVGASLIYFVVVFGLAFVTNLIVGPTQRFGPSGIETDFGKMGLQLVLNVVTTAISSTILVGMISMGVRQSRGEATSLNTIFEPFRRFVPVAGSQFLYAVLVYVSLAACIIPAFFVAPTLFLMGAVADLQGRGAFDALGTTFNACKRHWAGLFGLLLIMSLIAAVGILGLGSAFSSHSLFTAWSWRSITGHSSSSAYRRLRNRFTTSLGVRELAPALPQRACSRTHRRPSTERLYPGSRTIPPRDLRNLSSQGSRTPCLCPESRRNYRSRPLRSKP